MGDFRPSSAVVIRDISGNFLSVTSGVGLNVNVVSGQLNVNTSGATYSALHFPNTLVVTGASGGVALVSSASDFVMITNIGLSGNSVFIGTSGEPPFAATLQSGKGFRTHNYGTFVSPPSVTLPTLGNMFNIRVVASISGEPISYIGLR